jgi:hypothetical protein
MNRRFVFALPSCKPNRIATSCVVNFSESMESCMERILRWIVFCGYGIGLYRSFC